MTDTSTIYNKISKNYENTHQIPSYKIDEFLNRLPKCAKILDVGCGPGTDYKYMTEKGFDVYGSDASREMIKLAQAKNLQGKFEIADMRDLQLEPNSIDGVFVSFSLIHIPKKDTAKTLKTFYNILKPGGLIFVGVQEGESDEVYIAHQHNPEDKIFFNIFSSKELRALLKEAGFTILKQYRRPPNLENELNFKKLVLIGRK